MKKGFQILIVLCSISCMAVTCKKQTTNSGTPPGDTTVVIPPADTPLVNTKHVDYLTVPVTFPDNTIAAGVYIYANAPGYTLTAASGEGYTCVDDVARAVLVYLRQPKFSTDTSLQSKAVKLMNFIVEMQSPNGYFYNFLLSVNQINTNGNTSVNNANWWSWRALQALTEGSSAIKSINPDLSTKMDNAVNKLVAVMKTDLINLPQTTKVVSGITVPQWLPAGSGTDQSATIILGLIPYCKSSMDQVMTTYVKKLADGIALMQQGNATNFPFGAFLSWENTWHAYGNEQAYALLKAGSFLNDTSYTNKALTEINNFYPWLIKYGYESSFIVANNGTSIDLTSNQSYDQIAYGIAPMVFAAVEAYRLTNDNKYADLAGHIAAWLLGNNNAHTVMYSTVTGRCFDGIGSSSSVNTNSGAESTIEALLVMGFADNYPAVKTALNTYKK